VKKKGTGYSETRYQELGTRKPGTGYFSSNPRQKVACLFFRFPIASMHRHSGESRNPACPVIPVEAGIQYASSFRWRPESSAIVGLRYPLLITVRRHLDTPGSGSRAGPGIQHAPIGVGTIHWFVSLLPPNRTCGSLASGSPVGGFTSMRTGAIFDGPPQD